MFSKVMYLPQPVNAIFQTPTPIDALLWFATLPCGAVPLTIHPRLT
jgi:hypothetical protein